MPTFTYGPTESVTIAPNGDVSVTDGATTTTYAKGGATKTVTKNPPGPNPPPPPENPVSKKVKGGDTNHTYTDLSQNPPVTTKITFRGNGDVEILVTKGQDKTRIDINGGTGVRRTRTWTEPAAEPTTWGKSENPSPAPAPAAPTGGSSTAPVGSPTTGGKKPKKKPKRGKAARTVRKGKAKRKKARR
jgi:hypothetical protein